MPSHATVGRNVEEVVSADSKDGRDANSSSRSRKPRRTKAASSSPSSKPTKGRKRQGKGTKPAAPARAKRGRGKANASSPPVSAKEEPEENEIKPEKRKRDSSPDPEQPSTPSSVKSPPAKRRRQGNSKRDANWNSRFEELKAFRDEHGHCNVPTEGGNNKLGNWVSRQRDQYRVREKSPDKSATSLDEERIKKLESIGFKWRLPPGCPKTKEKLEEESEKSKEEKRAAAEAAEAAEDAKWKEMFFQLVLYKAENGSCMVPIVYTGHKSLGAWVGNQRHKYRQRHLGEKAGTTLTPDRIKALEAIDFSWGVHEDRWEKRFSELVAFKEKHGHCIVPTAKGQALGRWVNQQRMSRAVLLTGEKKSKGCAMTPERYERLDALGFTWRLKDRTTWDVRFGELIEFKKEFGHCIVPQHFAQNKPLGKWVTKQRYERSKMLKGQHSAMTEERIEALDSLGFAWSATSRRSTGDDAGRGGQDDYDDHGDHGEDYQDHYGDQEEASQQHHHQEEVSQQHHHQEEVSHHHHHQEEASAEYSTDYPAAQPAEVSNPAQNPFMAEHVGMG